MGIENKAGAEDGAAVGCSALLACPFCGGAAESDLMQGFRRMKDGHMSNAVAIYCTRCAAQMSMCHEDFPEYTPQDCLGVMTDAWNIRQANVPVSDGANVNQSL